MTRRLVLPVHVSGSAGNNPEKSGVRLRNLVVGQQALNMKFYPVYSHAGPEQAAGHTGRV